METSSLAFVAAMVSWGSKVVRTERNGKRVIFYLEDPPREIPTIVVGSNRLDSIVTGTFEQLYILFNSRRMLYHPSYPDAMRNLKSVIYG